MLTQERSAVFILLFGSILWGLTWLPLKYFKDSGIEGIPLILVGYGAVALVMLPVFLKQLPQWLCHQKYIWFIFFVSGLANLAFTLAIMHGDVIRVMILFYLIPAWGVLGGKFFLKENVDNIRWLAVFLALLGAFLVLGGSKIFHSPPSWIDLFALCSGFALSMNNIAFRASPQLPLPSKLSAIFIGSFFTAAILIVLNVQEMPSVPFFNWLTVIAFVGIWILIATISTQWAVTKLEVGRASILIITELLTAVLSAMWITNERLTAPEMIGGLLILIAAICEAWRNNPKQPSLATHSSGETIS